jgi:hypothetical protein
MNWTSANRYRLMKEYYPADYERVKQEVPGIHTRGHRLDALALDRQQEPVGIFVEETVRIGTSDQVGSNHAEGKIAEHTRVERRPGRSPDYSASSLIPFRIVYGASDLDCPPEAL